MGNPRRETMLSNIHEWHDNDEHEKILEEIDKIPREFWDYEITCLYARALNNIEQYEEALNLLLNVKTLGKNDALWNFRTGYSLYFLEREEEASKYLQKAIDLGDDTEDTGRLLSASLEEAKQKKNIKTEFDPVVYSEEELDALEQHIERYFGPYKNVFHEIASPDIHVDIVVIEPIPERNYYVLVTMGMGARKMDVPEELEEYHLKRAEIMVCLPPDWRLDTLDDEKWYWPLRWLKILARLPGEQNTWLGWGHTIPNGDSFAENTGLSSVILIYPGAFGEKSFCCKLPGGDEVNFYQMIPLYNEEVKYKLEHNAEALLELMDNLDLEFVKPDRKLVTGD
jgi:tetratricopeptide (TPR) repeat protein